MATEPPSPPAPIGPLRMPTRGATPWPVIAVSILMMFVGALVALGGFIATVGGGALLTQLPAAGRLVVVPIGILAILTGAKILRLSTTWRVIGLALAASGCLLSLFLVFQDDADILEGLGGLAIYGFVIWALVRYAPAFTR